MTREEMLAFARELITDYQKSIEEVLGSESADYTWQDMLADYTGVEVETFEEFEALSDEALKQIADAYI